MIAIEILAKLPVVLLATVSSQNEKHDHLGYGMNCVHLRTQDPSLRLKIPRLRSG